MCFRTEQRVSIGALDEATLTGGIPGPTFSIPKYLSPPSSRSGPAPSRSFSSGLSAGPEWSFFDGDNPAPELLDIYASDIRRQRARRIGHGASASLKAPRRIRDERDLSCTYRAPFELSEKRRHDDREPYDKS